MRILLRLSISGLGFTMWHNSGQRDTENSLGRLWEVFLVLKKRYKRRKKFLKKNFFFWVFSPFERILLPFLDYKGTILGTKAKVLVRAPQIEKWSGSSMMSWRVSTYFFCYFLSHFRFRILLTCSQEYASWFRWYPSQVDNY